MNWLKRIIRSVFTKLLVVIVLTGICVNLVVGGFFWIHRSAAGRPLHRNILQYLNYIIDALGNPMKAHLSVGLLPTVLLMPARRAGGTGVKTLHFVLADITAITSLKSPMTWADLYSGWIRVSSWILNGVVW